MSYLDMSDEEIHDCVERGGLDDDMFFGLYEESKLKIEKQSELIEILLTSLCNRNADDYVDMIRQKYNL